MQARIFPSFLSSLRTKYEKLGDFSFPIGIIDNMTDEDEKDLFEKLLDQIGAMLDSVGK